MFLRKLTLLAMCIAVTATASCTPAQRAKVDNARDVARSVDDMARALCLSAHAKQLGVDPAELKESVCSTLEDLAPFRRALLGAQRDGSIAAGLARQ